jgi:hypothetical protein
MTSWSLTGRVINISSVPLRFSSARRRIVMTGTIRKDRPRGAYSKSLAIEARSACQKPPLM